MEDLRPRFRKIPSLLTTINFILCLIILFCANYLYIEFLFR